MKNFLQQLLVFFALCLCGLMVFQWVRETALNRDIQKLTNTVQDKTETILNLQATVRQNNDEIKRLDGLKNQLTELVKSNEVEIATLTKDLQKVRAENDKNQRQMEIFKDAFEKEKVAVQQGNENIEKLNAQLKQQAEERNGLVKRFNKTIENLNGLTEQLNKMVLDFNKGATNLPAMTSDLKVYMEQWGKMQKDLSATNAPATNAPASQ